MNTDENTDFKYTFESSKTIETIYATLLDVRQWWVGLYNEEIEGETKQINDEFTFRAGDGVHYSKQRLVELIPNSKIKWQVIESHLSFVKKNDEWTNSRFGFEIISNNN
ncbi:MAG: SRPBCC domain-containing protein, partial [Bacteroidetes bacterium]|nr:SRPBCC domain-containing protein [Bacteroidota bacterium]